MTLRLSETEAAALRAAPSTRPSMQDAARQAVQEHVESHSKLICSTECWTRNCQVGGIQLTGL